MFNGQIKRAVYSKPVKYFILILTFISLVLLLSEKIIPVTPYNLDIFEKIDFVILIIFTVEFVLKMFISAKNYFFSEYGWVDFLSVLPIFSPALKVLRGVKLLRPIKLLRMLRLLRVLRILKISKQSVPSDLKQKVFIPVSSVVMIMVLIVGFIMSEYIKKVHISSFFSKYDKQISEFKKNGNINFLDPIPELISIEKNNSEILRKIDKSVVKRTLIPEEIYNVKLNLNDNQYILTFNIKKIYLKIRRIELLIILFALFTIIAVVSLSNFIINKNVLNPIIELNKRFDSVIKKNEIPGSSEKHIEINFESFIPYISNDEIGNLSRNFSNLLFELKKQYIKSKNVIANICATIMAIFGKYHSVTKGHIYRSAAISSAIAYALNVPEKQREELYFGMLLHDIGKIGVDKEILTKDGKLTPEERKKIEEHPTIGYDIAKDFPLLTTTELLVIRDHHENVDGSGYPNKSGKLSLIAKIASVADVFDALLSPRDYKTALPIEKVKKIMTNDRNVKFDGTVLDTLFDLIDKNIIMINCVLENDYEWIKIDEEKLGAKVYFI